MSDEQARYQVRFEWGVAGAKAVGSDADVIIWVDTLGGAPASLLDELPKSPGVVVTGLASAQAVANWVVDEQVRLGRRFATAVIAAGKTREDSLRFAVEDQLAAGAVIERLSTLGLDATSPEAAVAEASYRSLSRAIGHLITASTSVVNDGVVPATQQLHIDPNARVHQECILRKIPD